MQGAVMNILSAWSFVTRWQHKSCYSVVGLQRDALASVLPEVFLALRVADAVLVRRAGDEPEKLRDVAATPALQGKSLNDPKRCS